MAQGEPRIESVVLDESSASEPFEARTWYALRICGIILFLLTVLMYILLVRVANAQAQCREGVVCETMDDFSSLSSGHQDDEVEAPEIVVEVPPDEASSGWLSIIEFWPFDFLRSIYECSSEDELSDDAPTDEMLSTR